MIESGLCLIALFRMLGVSVAFETFSKLFDFRSLVFSSYSHIALNGEPIPSSQAIPEMAIMPRQYSDAWWKFLQWKK